MADSLKFGTSGLRGLASELVGAGSQDYAAAFVRHLRQRGTVAEMLVGRDLRASSPEIARSVTAALDGAGVRAIDCGEVPTPALALEAMRRGVPAIMITGSHIPADRNGLKFYRADGEIDKDDEAGIVAALGPATLGDAAAAVVDPAVRRHYLQRYAQVLPHAALSGWRIGVWQHSSVARDLLAELLDGLGAEVVALGRSEHFVAVDTEAISSDVAAELAGWVHAHQLDALVSTDGDADRPLLVDETGVQVRGDVAGILAARFLGADAVVTPVTSNSSIESTGYFARVVRTRVGSPYVIAGMRDAGKMVVGFEANGGLLLGSDLTRDGTALTALPTRDAVLPLLAVLGAAKAAGGTVSQLVATLPPRFARGDRLQHVPAERSAMLLERLRSDAAGFLASQGAIASASDIDGLRYELQSGDVIHYRPSGNAPELRCYTEAATPERAEALLAWGLKAAEAVVR